MKLPGSTEHKITKDKSGENVAQLQKQYYFIVILSIMIINKIQEPCIYLFQINHLVVY